MTATQLILGLLTGFLLIVALYIGYRVAAFQLDKRLPRPVQVVPVATAEAPTMPPTGWWDALQGLQIHVDQEVMRMQGYANAAEQAYRNARSSEERARKRERRLDDDEEEEGGLPPAHLVSAPPDGWENEQLAPAGQAPSRNGRAAQIAAVMEQRRARGQS